MLGGLGDKFSITMGRKLDYKALGFKKLSGPCENQALS